MVTRIFANNPPQKITLHLSSKSRKTYDEGQNSAEKETLMKNHSNKHALNNILLGLANLAQNSPHRLGLENVALGFNMALAKPTLVLGSGSAKLTAKLFEQNVASSIVPATSDWEAIIQFGPEYGKELLQHGVNIKHGMGPLFIACQKDPAWKNALLERTKLAGFIYPLMKVAFNPNCTDKRFWEELFTATLRIHPMECAEILNQLATEHNLSHIVPFILAGFFPTHTNPPKTLSAWYFQKMKSAHQQVKLKSQFPTIADYLLDHDAAFAYVDHERQLCRTELKA